MVWFKKPSFQYVSIMYICKFIKTKLRHRLLNRFFIAIIAIKKFLFVKIIFFVFDCALNSLDLCACFL
jgi:hypothetical protein